MVSSDSIAIASELPMYRPVQQRRQMSLMVVNELTSITNGVRDSLKNYFNEEWAVLNFSWDDH